MKEDVLDVLMYLFDHYLQLMPEEVGDEAALAEELQDAGFGVKEIQKAFKWLSQLSKTQEAKELHASFPTMDRAWRLLTSEEMLKLDTEARRYLFVLEQQRVLEPFLREWILERAMALEGTVLGLSEFKRIISLALAERATAPAVRAFAERLMYEDIGGILQ